MNGWDERRRKLIKNIGYPISRNSRYASETSPEMTVGARSKQVKMGMVGVGEKSRLGVGEREWRQLKSRWDHPPKTPT